MPTYEYKCEECGHKFEEFQSITADPLETCPECNGEVKRLIGAGGGLIFKGSGFYTTDYRSSSYQERAQSEKSSGEKDSSSESSSSSEKEVSSKKESSSSTSEE